MSVFVREGIILVQNLLKSGLEIDKTKVEAIEKFPPPISVKGVRCFLGHARFTSNSSRSFPRLLDLCAVFRSRRRDLILIRCV